jgi:hypothetical protein
MLARVFHAWERRLASATTDRVVRPFDWGLDWLPHNGHPPGAAPLDVLRDFAAGAMADSDRFYAAAPAGDYALRGSDLTFSSAMQTPHPANNTVHARYFPAGRRARTAVPTRRAVLVLPQWNADTGSHVGLCRWLAFEGLSALRLSLPYHDARMPPELHRADYIVSANLARTLQVCRQAVLDARRAVAWLAARGYDRIGILGTSLGSCLAMLTAAHEPRIDAAALNHISPHFADVVWRGLSTSHVREGLADRITLDDLRHVWLPISPQPFLERVRGRRILLVYARYDLTFPLDLSRQLVDAFQSHGIEPEVSVLPCGHYSTGAAPFKYWDGHVLVRFLKKALDSRPQASA